jgi:hypothetical protein
MRKLILDVTAEKKNRVIIGEGKTRSFVMSSKMGQPCGPIGKKTTKKDVKNPPHILTVNS